MTIIKVNCTVNRFNLNTSRLVSKSVKVFLLLLSLCSFSSSAIENAQQAKSERVLAPANIETLIGELNSPWAMAWLPNGDMLITELDGALRRVHKGSLVKEPIAGVPSVYRAGQGGLLDVFVDRDFEQNKRIYLSFAYGKAKANATRLISAVLNDDHLDEVTVLFTAKPFKATAHHFAGRIAQLADSTLLLTVGDGFNYREQAQKLDNHLGKIIRINRDGGIPSDNPWAKGVGNDKVVSKKDALQDPLPEIYSYGHRNPQAILVTSKGQIYEHEHGPKGGDEINLIEPGHNYGWPVITYGIDYNGATITPYTQYEGMEQPLHYWTPSIAPSAMTYYQGEQFPQWQDDLLVVSLAQKSLRHVKLSQNETETSVVSDLRVMPEQLDMRIRDISTGPDGAVYVLTDGKIGQLLRLTKP